MVRRLLSIDPAAGCWRDAAELAEELAEKNFGEKFPEPKLCEQCSGNIFWLDYDGKIFCNHCFQPAGPPAKFLAVCSSPARWEDARRPKLKTVAEVCQEWEEKYFAEAKKFWPEFREHFRKNFTYSSSEALESWKGDTSRASKSSKSAASRGARR